MSPHRAPAQDVGRVQRHLHAPPFQVARLPGKAQAGLEYLPHLVVQYQLGAKHLQCALGKGPILHLNPQRHLPADVEVRSGLGLDVADLVVGLEQQGSGQQAGRHAVPAIVGAVELGEVGVPEQPAPPRGQQTVEGVLADMVQIQPICFPETPLVRTLSQHSQPSLRLLSLLTPSIPTAELTPLSGQISSTASGWNRCTYVPKHDRARVVENLQSIVATA